MSNLGSTSSGILVQVGEEAPDFELYDQHGQTVRLSSYRESSKVLLVFYPFAFTGVCGTELAELQQNLDELRESNVEVLAVSVDSRYSQRVFADREGYTYPMVADFWPHGAVAQRYGVFDDGAGVALRATFLIDRNGVVRWTVMSGIGKARSMADYRDAIEGF